MPLTMPSNSTKIRLTTAVTAVIAVIAITAIASSTASFIGVTTAIVRAIIAIIEFIIMTEMLTEFIRVIISLNLCDHLMLAKSDLSMPVAIVMIRVVVVVIAVGIVTITTVVKDISRVVIAEGLLAEIATTAFIIKAIDEKKAMKLLELIE